jgi:hypothetical protein
MGNRKQSIVGWGVYRCSPWHFAGVFATAEKARVVAARLGHDYQAAFGEHTAGTVEFFASSAMEDEMKSETARA